jgi:hypothetical protein
MERTRILQAVKLLSQHSDLDDRLLVAELSNAGFSTIEAHLLVVILPMAFSRPLLEKAGITHFSPTITATSRAGRRVEIPEKELPLFSEALAIAREHYRSGILDAMDYERITHRSADANALARALNEGLDVKVGSMASVILWPCAEDLGYEPQASVSAKGEVGADGVKPCISCGNLIPKSYTKCLHCYTSQPQ